MGRSDEQPNHDKKTDSQSAFLITIIILVALIGMVGFIAYYVIQAGYGHDYISPFIPNFPIGSIVTTIVSIIIATGIRNNYIRFTTPKKWLYSFIVFITIIMIYIIYAMTSSTIFYD